MWKDCIMDQYSKVSVQPTVKSARKRTVKVLISVIAAAMVLVVICFFIANAFAPRAVLHEAGEVGYIPCAAQLLQFSGIKSPQYFVYDVDLEEFVALKGENRVIYPASTTKLLTILYALSLLDPKTEVTPGDELTLVGAGSSIAYVRQEHTLTVSMLIEGMLLPSGNDAAYALAAAGGYVLDPSAADGISAVAAFMKGMANYAEAIGLCGSHFTVPDGFAGEEHYTTLEDMAIVASLAFKNDLIMSYACLAEDDVVYASGHTNHWVNTNVLLDQGSSYYDSRVTGLKTGSVDGSYNLICTAESGTHRYIIGLFGASDKDSRFADAKRILNGLFGQLV